MKLLTGLSIALINAKAPKDCDLSETGIFDSVGYGLNRYTYNIDYRIKTSGKLENKGKVKQAAAELIHQHSNSAKAQFTDAWVSCTDIEVGVQYYIKCNNDGTFEIDGKSGSDIVLPDCSVKGTTTVRVKTTKPPRATKPPRNSRKPKSTTAAPTTKKVYTTPSSFKPVKPFKQLKPDKGSKKAKREKPACDPADLGAFGKITYTSEHGCKKGYENGKEKKNNSCVRQCQGSNGTIKTNVPIACYCKKDNCFYQIKLKKVGKIAWDATNPETGERYISEAECTGDTEGGKEQSVQMASAGSIGVESTCLPLENDGDSVWMCSDGNEPGSTCTKQCNEGLMNAENALEMTCQCSEGCQWQSNNGVEKCSKQECTMPSAYGWTSTEGVVKCYGVNGKELGNGDKMHPGTVCGQECPAYFRVPLNSMGVDGVAASTCKCYVENNLRKCSFDANLQSCLPALCDTNTKKLYGLDVNDKKAESPYEITCADPVPDKHEFAGMAQYGSSCMVTCAPGWRLALGGADSFNLVCGVNQGEFGWVDQGPYPKCARACSDIEKDPLNEKEKQAGLPNDAVIWNCNDSNFEGSVCQKTCGEGYFIKGNKSVTSCYCKSKNCDQGPVWKGETSNCRLSLLLRGETGDRQSDEEEAQAAKPEPPTKKEEVKIQMDEFIANIFGF